MHVQLMSASNHKTLSHLGQSAQHSRRSPLKTRPPKTHADLPANTSFPPDKSPAAHAMDHVIQHTFLYALMTII